jgi:hypothetical protein
MNQLTKIIKSSARIKFLSRVEKQTVYVIRPITK